MGRIVRELKTLPGAILSITLLLIVTFYVWNFIATRAPSPISSAGAFALGAASGSRYAAAPAAPAMSTSPYSVANSNGPLI